MIAARDVATGFATGDQPVPELAALAVKDALVNAGSDYAHSVILLLSGHFVRHAQIAITAASRAAGCLQVTGCTVPGVFTENAWSLDKPAAAALVLCGPISLGLPRTEPNENESKSRLSFAIPSQIEAAWIADGTPRIGTIATNGEGEAEGQVWVQGKLSVSGRAEVTFHGGQLQTVVSRGIKMLTLPLEVTDSDNFELLQLGEQTALDSLLRQLDPETRKLDTLPPQRFFAALPEPGMDAELAISTGRYSLMPILRVNRDERSITLAAPLPLHSRLCWALREPASAESDMRAATDQLAVAAPLPAFGLMFSCIGRGPYFYQGHDLDVSLMRERFPGMPLLGAYCAGEIAPIGPLSSLVSYSSVASVVTPIVLPHV